MSDSVSVFTRDNLILFHEMFEEYWKLTGKGRPDSLSKTAKNFSYFAFRRLREKAYPKGAIEKERLSSFKSGGGLKIGQRAREIVYRKLGVHFAFATAIRPASPTMAPMGSHVFMAGEAGKKRGLTSKQQKFIERINTKAGSHLAIYAALAQQEIKLREGHRMFSVVSVLFKGPLKELTYSTSKIGKPLGRARPQVINDEHDAFVFDFGNSVGKYSAEAATGLNSPKMRPQLEPALVDTMNNMREYISRKQKEFGKAAANKIR